MDSGHQIKVFTTSSNVSFYPLNFNKIISLFKVGSIRGEIDNVYLSQMYWIGREVYCIYTCVTCLPLWKTVLLCIIAFKSTLGAKIIRNNFQKCVNKIVIQTYIYLFFVYNFLCYVPDTLKIVLCSVMNYLLLCFSIL